MAILATIFGLFHKKLYCSKFERYNVQKLNTKFFITMEDDQDHFNILREIQKNQTRLRDN